MIDLTHLEAVARAATPGPWERLLANDITGVSDVIAGNRVVCENLRERDAAFIAALSPDVVLELINEIRQLREAIASENCS